MENFDDIYGRISASEVKRACDDILAYFCGPDDIGVKPLTSGPKKAVHFSWNGKVIYGFIANQNWLLWYFRKPGTTTGAFSFENVLTAFPEAAFTSRKDPAIKEITIKITDPEGASRIIEFVHRHPKMR